MVINPIKSGVGGEGGGGGLERRSFFSLVNLNFKSFLNEL